MRFALRLAWREGRSGFRRIAVYLLSILIGVGTMVAIAGFRSDVASAVRAESRTLLGGDLRFEAQTPFPDEVEFLLDSLGTADSRIARSTTLLSMVAPASGGEPRLFQIRGVTAGFPLEGSVRSEPADGWSRLAGGGIALADPAVALQLGLRTGDRIRIGELELPFGGTVAGLPADVGFQTAVGPRVYLLLDDLRATGLLGFGSFARYQAFVRLPDPGDADRIVSGREDALRALGVDTDTPEEQAESLSSALEDLGRFLGMIGLVALLLGGIGVASAIHVFVRERRTSIAVLRCIGARQNQVFAAYILEAVGIGLAGSLTGALVGVGLQFSLPALLREFLPVAVDPSVHWGGIFGGLLLGLVVSTGFALLPLLEVRDVPPLRAIRLDPESGAAGEGGGRLRWIVMAALGGALLLASISQAPDPAAGAGFAAAIGGVLFLLRGAAVLLIRVLRRGTAERTPWAVRQGIANLFRPRNQTVAVTTVVGFGTFLLAMIIGIERNLSERFRLDADAGSADVILFDVQPAQRDSLLGQLSDGGTRVISESPLVPARIAAIGGVEVEELVRRRSAGEPGPERWALRRVYRNSWRERPGGAEEVVAGRWWDEGDPVAGVPRISVEEDLAQDLGLSLGDRIDWDVQGIRVPSVVASFRRVDWARFEPNFFVLFEPGAIEAAPQTIVILADAPAGASIGALSTTLLRSFPNVSLLDLGEARSTIDRIVGTVRRAVGVLALIAVAGGGIVLAGALATSRQARMREAALLRTLGALRVRVLRVLFMEYLVLGALGALAGVLLALPAMAWVVRSAFAIPFVVPLLPLSALMGGVIVLAVGLGTLASLGILSRPPLGVLREFPDHG